MRQLKQKIDKQIRIVDAVKCVTIKCFYPGRKKPDIQRVRPKKGNFYTPEQIDSILDQVVDYLEKNYPRFEFRFLQLPGYQWNIIPVTEGEGRVRNFEVKLGGLGGKVASILISTASLDVVKVDSTAVQAEGVIVRVTSGYITEITELNPEPVVDDPTLVKGVSTNEMPAPEPERPDTLVKGVSSHGEDAAADPEPISPEAAAAAGVPIRQTTEFSEANAVEDLEGTNTTK